MAIHLPSVIFLPECTRKEDIDPNTQNSFPPAYLEFANKFRCSTENRNPQNLSFIQYDVLERGLGVKRLEEEF